LFDDIALWLSSAGRCGSLFAVGVGFGGLLLSIDSVFISV